MIARSAHKQTVGSGSELLLYPDQLINLTRARVDARLHYTMGFLVSSSFLPTVLLPSHDDVHLVELLLGVRCRSRLVKQHKLYCRETPSSIINKAKLLFRGHFSDVLPRRRTQRLCLVLLDLCGSYCSIITYAPTLGTFLGTLTAPRSQQDGLYLPSYLCRPASKSGLAASHLGVYFKRQQCLGYASIKVIA